MGIKLKYRIASLFVFLCMGANASIAREFDDADIFPDISGVGFDQEAVGFAYKHSKGSVSTTLSSGDSGTLNNTDFYFLSKRKSRKLLEIDAQQFEQRFPGKLQLSNPATIPYVDGGDNDQEKLAGMTSNGMEFRLKLKYCGEGHRNDTLGVVVGNRDIRALTRKECTNVSSLEIVNGQLWLGTVYSGEGHYADAEGVIVQNMSGTKVFARISSLSGWVKRIHVDPFSRNVWIITNRGIYEISPQFKMLSVNLFYHDFEQSTGEPRLLTSNKTTESNPFAVISRHLPSEDRKRFHEVTTHIPIADRKLFALYDFFMCCDFDARKYPASLHLLTPFFIRASQQNDKSQEDYWRQAICRLGSVGTQQYCQRVNLGAP